MKMTVFTVVNLVIVIRNGKTMNKVITKFKYFRKFALEIFKRVNKLNQGREERYLAVYYLREKASSVTATGLKPTIT